MTRTARVEPIIKEERDDSILVSGWRVVDVSDPNGPTEVSRHDNEPEAIEAARSFEYATSSEPGSDPNDDQDYDSGEISDR